MCTHILRSTHGWVGGSCFADEPRVGARLVSQNGEGIGGINGTKNHSLPPLFPAWDILFNAGRREERGEWNGFRMMPLKHIAVRRWGYIKHRMGGGREGAKKWPHSESSSFE